MVTALCGVTHGESTVWSVAESLKKAKDLMLVFGLNETIDWLAMVNSVHWHGHVLRIDDGHFLRRALVIEVRGVW